MDRKPLVFRRATATGELALSARGRGAIRRRATEKGDPIATAEVAGLAALKRTAELLPHCHPVPLTGAKVEVRASKAGVRAEVEVEAIYRTGVEMEALVGVSVALLTVWDMVKYLEKDGEGQYPSTRLGPIRVLHKEKRNVEEPT